MAYFTTDYLNFLTELNQNNNRDWFNDNKKRFKENVEAPFKAFLQDLIEVASAADTRISITPKEAMFRIYKDTRFSKDKTPYKTHNAAIIGEGGRKGMKPNGIYIQSGFDSFGIFAGAYRPQPKQVKLIREAIASDLDGFQAVLDNKDFKEKFGEVKGEEHKRIPKEFAEAYTKQPLLIKKAFYVNHQFPADTILKADIIDICMEHFMAVQDFGEFLYAAYS